VGFIDHHVAPFSTRFAAAGANRFGSRALRQQRCLQLDGEHSSARATGGRTILRMPARFLRTTGPPRPCAPSVLSATFPGHRATGWDICDVRKPTFREPQARRTGLEPSESLPGCLLRIHCQNRRGTETRGGPPQADNAACDLKPDACSSPSRFVRSLLIALNPPLRRRRRVLPLPATPRCLPSFPGQGVSMLPAGVVAFMTAGTAAISGGTIPARNTRNWRGSLPTRSTGAL